jgi:hypothetical protein
MDLHLILRLLGLYVGRDSYSYGESVGIAQGRVIFDRVEGATSTVDKTFSFGIDDVITGHHSSAVGSD